MNFTRVLLHCFEFLVIFVVDSFSSFDNSPNPHRRAIINLAMDNLFICRIWSKKKILSILLISLLLTGCALTPNFNFGITLPALTNPTPTLSAGSSSNLANPSNPLTTQVTDLRTQKYIVFKGDSLTLGTDEGGPGSYPYQTRRLLDGLYGFVNLGIVSEGMGQMMADAAEEVDPYFNAQRLLNICVIWGGASDLTWANPADTYAQAKEFWAGRRAKGFKVVVTVIDAGTIDYATRLT